MIKSKIAKGSTIPPNDSIKKKACLVEVTDSELLQQGCGQTENVACFHSRNIGSPVAVLVYTTFAKSNCNVGLFVFVFLFLLFPSWCEPKKPAVLFTWGLKRVSAWSRKNCVQWGTLSNGLYREVRHQLRYAGNLLRALLPLKSEANFQLFPGYLFFSTVESFPEAMIHHKRPHTCAKISSPDTAHNVAKSPATG